MLVPLGALSLLAAEALLVRTADAIPTSEPSQWALVRDEPPELERPVRPVQRHLTEQNDTICDAGSRQWSGLVPLDAERDMFFWYFESRHQPQDAPLIIWLNGGPGASSLLGAFHEIGPCSVTEDGEKTVRSESSWTEFANMLFIDQPIGVGFSDPQDPSLWSKNLQESAIDLDKFLDVFLGEYFPSLQKRPIHFAGESFGGKYCPVYADLMRRRFDSVVLVNALVDYSDVSLGVYDHFCAAEPTDARRRGLNASTCEEMERGYSACEKFGRLCTATYDSDVCLTALLNCVEATEPYQREVVPGGQNPYDDRTKCIDPPMCGRLGMQEVRKYLNREEVQEALGFQPRTFEPVNMEFNANWSRQGDVFIPSTREIARLLDQKKTPILVLNGNNDAIVNTEGVLRTYESLLWSGHAAFRSRKLKPWYHGEAEDKNMSLGGTAKVVKNLALVTVDEAGHMSPHDQPLAVSRVMRAWIKDTDVSGSVVGLFD
ncbi:carboxypeptidase Y [Colletotrichum higginsianum]|uniref:Carboxypeptidase Y n=2 Tax=Colletotrichum higginsianum TaxID=80884 RepID=H1V2F5_COLHI|nr:Carboxypeptidase Y [Colletotrichum higginsianum IMI 349063]OBR02797.1 Carboxypeptidase Y [Colletotrichum higginsianum IMI 349063]TID06789.1 Carboxypeptidase Y-like protein [Colletotrichum higginsianum]CCF34407.1 carboxypeptidase Y [Colletotrichum higginsianum]